PTTPAVVPPASTPPPVAPPASAGPQMPLAFDSLDGPHGVRWVGRDADRTISAEDRARLRAVFGIDDVRRIFLPATAGEVLRYAAHPPGCPDEGRTATFYGSCRVVNIRVGLAAPRASGETWDAFTARVTHGGSRVWTAAGGRASYSGLDALDPDARPAFERLLTNARAAGFPVHVRETYRTPERQAAILARNDGRTTTLTSAHSYGRAVDISVGDGRLGRRSTYRTWVAFRRWVTEQDSGAFHIIGTPERTWDWPHVEYAGPALGYRSIDALVAAARTCQAGAATPDEAASRCTVTAYRPPESATVTTVSDEEPVSRSRRSRRHGSSRRGRSGRSHGTRSHASHAEHSHGGHAHGATSHGRSGSSHGGSSSHAKSSQAKSSHAKRSHRAR
ncbi:MAG TPA: hypothetical protein VGD56_04605, partial [Gemmatirosa sp.]